MFSFCPFSWGVCAIPDYNSSGRESREFLRTVFLTLPSWFNPTLTTPTELDCNLIISSEKEELNAERFRK